jgi:hypothetical protein
MKKENNKTFDLLKKMADLVGKYKLLHMPIQKKELFLFLYYCFIN